MLLLLLPSYELDPGSQDESSGAAAAMTFYRVSSGDVKLAHALDSCQKICAHIASNQGIYACSLLDLSTLINLIMPLRGEVMFGHRITASSF